MSSSAIPPRGPPRRGVPNSTGQALANDQPPASPWPLPRHPQPTDAPTGRRGRQPEPEAPLPLGGTGRLPKTTAQTGAIPPLQPSVQENARRRVPKPTVESTEDDELPVPEPPALDPRRGKKPSAVPPPSGAQEQPQPVPSFSLPKGKNNRAAPNFPEPLRTGPSGPMPSGPMPSLPNTRFVPPEQQTPAPLRRGPLGTTRPGPPPPRPGQPIPDALRPGIPPRQDQGQAQNPDFLPEQPGAIPPLSSTARPGPPPPRPGQPIPDALRPGKGKGPDFLPMQPGPAPSFPVPSPAQRQNTPNNTFGGDQGLPPPLRGGNLPPKPPQQPGRGAFSPNPMEPNLDPTGAPPFLDPRGKTDPRFRTGAPPLSSQPQPGPAGPFARKPVNNLNNPLTSPPPRPQMQPGVATGSQPQMPPGTNPLRSSPPNPQLRGQAGPNPAVYRPSMPPPQATGPPRQMPPRGANNPFGASSPPRPGPTYPGHAPSNSMDSNISDDSATSTRPLNQPQRQNTGFSQPQRQNMGFSPQRRNSDLPRDTTAGNNQYYSGDSGGGAAQTPYMNMLLSLDKIPRLHNILVLFFTWILLAGFVIIPGSFTSSKRKQEGESVQIPIGGAASKLALTPANTAAMVIGFICIVTGTFGAAWLALRWRRNYVWLLNKLYMPLVLNALAGIIATVTSVYTQQAGEWSPQALTTVIVEASIFGLNLILFFVYNFWLLQRVRSDHEEKMEGGKDRKKKKKDKKDKKDKKKKKEKKEKKSGGLWARMKARMRRGRKKPSYAAGSVV